LAWSGKTNTIITMIVALIMVGVLLPIGIADLVDYDGSYNASYTNDTGGTEYNTGTNTTIATLVNTIIPVMIVIVLIMGFLAYQRYRN
jgi:fumarate reductase subunit D